MGNDGGSDLLLIEESGAKPAIVGDFRTPEADLKVRLYSG
jgi:hypothetical protein